MKTIEYFKIFEDFLLELKENSPEQDINAAEVGEAIAMFISRRPEIYDHIKFYFIIKAESDKKISYFHTNYSNTNHNNDYIAIAAESLYYSFGRSYPDSSGYILDKKLKPYDFTNKDGYSFVYKITSSYEVAVEEVEKILKEFKYIKLPAK